MYSWIWVFLRPSAGSLMGMTIFEPSHTTVDISAEYSVRIWSSSKWTSWAKPITSA